MQKMAIFLICCMAYCVVVPFSEVSAQVTDAAQWEADYQNFFPNTGPDTDNTDGNDNRKFAWSAHYWVRAYVAMATLTGDTIYLDRAVNLIDHMFYYRDDERVARGEIDLSIEPYGSGPNFYLQNPTIPFPGWRRWGGDTHGWRALMLDNGQITHAIMRFVDFVYNKPQYAAYQANADLYMTKIEETVAAFDPNFVFDREPDIPGSYYYPDRDGDGLYAGAVELNHNATMGVTLLLLDKLKGGVPAYRQKAEAIWAYFQNDLTLIQNDAYTWHYHPQNFNVTTTDSGYEDLQHAHLDISFALLAYQLGAGPTLTDMQRFTNTFTENIYKGNGVVSWSVDGTDPMNQNEYFASAYDWIDLAQFNSKSLDIGQEVFTVEGVRVNWGKGALGWAEILKWSDLFPEVTITAPSDDAVVTEIVTITADASDAVGIAGVQFLLDGNPLGGEDVEAPYAIDWDTGTDIGYHTLTAVARNVDGYLQTSVPVTVNVYDPTLPLVNITSPADNAVVAGVVTITADASDDVGVTGVQFLLDGNPLGAEDVEAPYAIDWDTNTYDPGTYVLTAVVRDGDLNEITSSSVNVTIIDTKIYAASEASQRSTIVSGNYTTTHVADGVYEQLREGLSGGKPSNRYSLLNHTWTFTGVPVSTPLVFSISAWRPDNTEGDDFNIQFSTDSNTFNTVLTVNSSTNTVYSAALPEVNSSTIYIRAVDTDDGQGNQVFDDLYVDFMYIDANGTPPPPPPSVTMFVGEAILVDRISSKGNKDRGQAQITVYDEMMSPVSGATVTGQFSGPSNDIVSAITNGNGVAVVTSKPIRNASGDWCFTVQDISLGSNVYDESLNVETHGCESIATRVLAPVEFKLHQNYPNPLNPNTLIAYDIPEPTEVTLVVFNILGQEIIKLVEGPKAPGRYTVTWDGRNGRGQSVASGIYLYRLTTKTGTIQTRRMTLLK